MAPRTPARTATSSRRPAAPAEVAPASSVRGAAAGLARMREEQARAEARAEASKLTANEPFRFFVEVGQTREIVIVDEAPDFFRNEHGLQHPKTKRFNFFLPCIDDVANCPVCSIDSKPAYFAMYLTIIDLTPFVNSKDEEVLWSKKMLVVKLSQQKKIARLYEQHGTLRGMVLSMTRDGKMDASIGNDIQFIEFMSEEELSSYEAEYEDREGQLHEVFGDEPFDYEAIYPDMTESDLAKAAGVKGEDDGRAVRSSRTSRQSQTAAPDDTPPPSRAARRAGQAAPSQEAPAPARRAPARAAAQPAPARRAARPEAEQEPAVAPRRAARTAQAAPQEDPPQRARRAATRPGSNPLPDDEPEAAAPAPAAGDRASRRAALRGSR